MVNNILAILIGYLLGSILPAYILGKILKGIDIRKVGTFNPGTTNVKRELGLLPAIPTAIYDTLKGIISILIAQKIFHTPIFISYLAGFSAVLGHIFPFYLNFRGGQGAATLTGILLFNLYKIFVINKISFLITDLIILLIAIFSIFYISKTQEILSITILPLFSYLLILRAPFDWILITTLIIISYLLIIGIINIIRFDLIKINKEKLPNFPFWRTFIRPAGFSFVILSFFLNKITLLTLIGIILLLFFIFDLARILHTPIDQFFIKDLKNIFIILKEKETKRISSMTIFLLGSFLSFLLFEQKIAILAITFLIFGDFFAKIFGLAYGRRKFFNKTLEGTLAHFLGSLIFGYILGHHLNIPISLIFLGAITGTIVEALPFNIDDNLSVPLLSGATVSLILKIGSK
ncbi:MAG: glycerol-3-phosphate acyltransferase [candidate division WOR-3 bacterium]|nr:glycerol-3-phosphate acyltransferase [candidate division WOR-3 bacterium]MDW8114390.1 glycerol-3-phosphate acyltransferase [candidate division WOR-3 bacterium]